MVRFGLILLILLVALNIYLMPLIEQSNLPKIKKKQSKWLLWLIPFVWGFVLLYLFKKKE